MRYTEAYVEQQLGRIDKLEQDISDASALIERVRESAVTWKKANMPMMPVHVVLEILDNA